MFPAEARRVALVIGNADYRIAPLANPVNDAAAVAQAFKERLGFDTVLLRKNLGVEAFRMALLELSREASGAEIGVVYFAGHGTEVSGKNYLLPVDARLAKAGNLSLEAIALDQVLDQLAGVTRLKLVILDACRNNPFSLPGARRTVRRGLARVEPEDNTLIAYAARDGTVADDGVGRRHSPYTEALLRHIATPGLEINLLFRRVRDDVMRATRHEAQPQQPHTYASLGGQPLFLRPAAGATATVAPTPPLLRPSRAEVAQVCQAVAANPSLAVVRSLRETYRGTPMYACIEARIEELQKPTRLSAESVIAEKGKWISRFNVDFGSRSAPQYFSHYFIVVEGSSYVAPGAIVTGRKWDSSTSPLWRIVHGHLEKTRDNSWYILGGRLAYLGTRWQPEFSQLSDTLFRRLGGRRMTKTVVHP